MLVACLLLLLAGCTNKVSEVKREAFTIPKFKNPRPISKKYKYPAGWSKSISINISKHMSVKDVLSRISTAAGINLNLEDIEDVQGISYTASNISFLRALKAICRLCKWRIKINAIGDISVLKDDKYFYTHEVAFLLHLRKMKLTTSIEALGKTSKSDNTVTQLSSENELNLWNEIEQNLRFLLREDKNRYTLNKQGGLIIINATQAEHQDIAHFLRQLYIRVASQVFIEGRIIEVILHDPHANGIDWDLLGWININNDSDPKFVKGVIQNLASGVEFLKNFGQTKTLASPSTYVLNNQFAIFQAIENRPNFKLSVKHGGLDIKKDTENAFYLPKDTVTSDLSMVPIGIVFIVQPSIDFTNRSVTLCLKPTISSSDPNESIEDPAVSILSKNKTRSSFPIVKEKSIDTIINVPDGETAILAGLRQEEEYPAKIQLSRGRLSIKTDAKSSREMVMLIKVNIVEPETNRRLSMSECEVMDPL